MGVDVGGLRRAGVVDERDARGRPGNVGTAVLADQSEREVVHGAEGRRRGHSGVGDDEVLGLDVSAGASSSQLVGEEPRRRRPAALEQSRLREQEGADTDRHHDIAGRGMRADRRDLRGEGRKLRVHIETLHELEAGYDKDVDVAERRDGHCHTTRRDHATAGGDDRDVVSGAVRTGNVCGHGQEIGHREHLGREATRIREHTDPQRTHSLHLAIIRVARLPLYLAIWPLVVGESAVQSVRMSAPNGHRDDPITDFSRRRVDVDGVEKTVYMAGSGPAVILMPEMPGISPDVLRFARWVRDAGFTVYVPSLFGIDGAYPTVEGGEQVVRRACVSAEFRAFAGGGTSPISAWLCGLARQAHAECGGPGVGAIGLCFTGNFALTMTLEPAVIAPVVNHPSLPLDDPAGLELSDEDAMAIRDRIERDGITVLAYRFDSDRWCTEQRFSAYQTLLGDSFDGRVLPGGCANANPPPFFRDVVRTPHSVVTAHFVDEEGHPTRKARSEILAHLAAQLRLTLRTQPAEVVSRGYEGSDPGRESHG